MFAVRYTWKSPASMENILPFWNMTVSYMTFEERELKEPTEAQKASDTPTSTARNKEKESELKVVINIWTGAEGIFPFKCVMTTLYWSLFFISIWGRGDQGEGRQGNVSFQMCNDDL